MRDGRDISTWHRVHGDPRCESKWDNEEEYAMPTFTKLYTHDELNDTLMKLLRYSYDLDPEDFMINAKNLITATSPAEIAAIFNEVQPGLPPEAAQAILKVAEQVLAPEDWASLKKILELKD